MAETSRGRFITFEGGEGTGKSTQARLLKERLENRGRRVVQTREPGGSPGAEQIRKLLVEGEPERWTPMTETLLFMAARNDHVARVIEPALSDGTWVICDRFLDSTLVYQGVARGLGLERVRALQTAALGELVPDLTLILDLPPDTGLARTQNRKGAETRFERFEAEFHARLRAAFREIAEEEPGRCVLIDAGGSREAVASAIWRAVTGRLAP